MSRASSRRVDPGGDRVGPRLLGRRGSVVRHGDALEARVQERAEDGVARIAGAAHVVGHELAVPQHAAPSPARTTVLRHQERGDGLEPGLAVFADQHPARDAERDAGRCADGDGRVELHAPQVGRVAVLDELVADGPAVGLLDVPRQPRRQVGLLEDVPVGVPRQVPRDLPLRPCLVAGEALALVRGSRPLAQDGAAAAAGVHHQRERAARGTLPPVGDGWCHRGVVAPGGDAHPGDGHARPGDDEPGGHNPPFAARVGATPAHGGGGTASRGGGAVSGCVGGAGAAALGRTVRTARVPVAFVSSMTKVRAFLKTRSFMRRAPAVRAALSARSTATAANLNDSRQ